MTIYKTLSTLSFALAMIAGAVMFAPSSAKAGGFISNGALKRNGISCSDRAHTSQNCRPGKPANPPSRGCSKITLCRG